MDRDLAVLDADVDVEAEDQVRARHLLEVLDDLLVALVRVIFWSFQCENGCVPAAAMRRPFLRRGREESLRSSVTSCARLLDVAADAGADLDDRLVHLGLDALVQEDLALVEELLDVRAQLARLRIDDLELLLDPEA